MKVKTLVLKIKTFFALLCATFPFLFIQAQAQTNPISATALPTHFNYILVYVYSPDTLKKGPPQKKGPSHWHWLLKKTDNPSPVVDVKYLDAPLLKAYIRRIPAGDSIELSWQFRKAELTRQPDLASLQQLCTKRKIGLHIENWASSYAEK